MLIDATPMPTPPYDAADDIERRHFRYYAPCRFIYADAACRRYYFSRSHERYYFSPFHAAASAAIFSRARYYAMRAADAAPLLR
jgi:hypothetical protein